MQQHLWLHRILVRLQGEPEGTKDPPAGSPSEKPKKQISLEQLAAKF